jgi:ribonuclease J
VSHPHPELSPPPELPDQTLRIVALGGIGEIGRNMAIFEHSGRLLIVDCGILFPEDHQPGVDLILPDFTYLADRMDDVVGLILTHGHEDHIGAVPYLLRLRDDVPLYATRLTLGLLEAKLREHRITPVALEVAEGQTESIGPFDCEFIAVNHSIPDAIAVAIRTPEATVLHTGDFKMDQLPLDGRLTDLAAFARIGAEGVDLLMADSTNAEVPGFTVSEREITPVLAQIFESASKRIIVACVSTHVHRVQQVLNAAATHGRKVAIVGRSMVRNMGVAQELGYLSVPDGVVIGSDLIDHVPDDELVLVCTGSQGEPMAALSRIANGDHRIKVAAGDTVIIAASLIPGNESAVNRVINGLTRLQAKVIHQANARVHVSGHACSGELLYCYNVIKPRNAMPVHGEPRHLAANAQIAISSGVSQERVILAEDGVVVDLADGVARVVGMVPCGYVYIDGSTVGQTTDADLKNRRILGEEGFLSIVVVVNSFDGKVIAGPEVHASGFALDEQSLAELRALLSDALLQAANTGTVDVHEFQQVVRRVAGRWLNNTHRRRPLIVPQVIEA